MSPATSRSRRHRKSSRRATSAIERTDVRWIAVFAAVAGAFSGVEPTGLSAVDAAFGAFFAGVLTLAGTRARRWTWLLVSGGAFACAAPEPLWLLCGLLALAGAAGALVLDIRERALGAVVVGLAAQTLLHLDDIGPLGTTAVLAGLLAAPVLISGYRQARSKERRIARWGALVVVVGAGLALASYAGAAVVARDKLQTGLDQATAGLDAVREGDDAEAERLLGESVDSFASAKSLLSGPLAWPARALPGLGHTVGATAEMASSGHALVSAAHETATTLDYDALAVTDGTVDLAEISALTPLLVVSHDALLAADERLAEVTSPWLPAPVSDPLERFQREVAEAIPDAELARGAAESAPWLLGADSPRTYLVLFGQPAESRFGGGFVGTWAELSATGGEIERTKSGSIEELIDGGAGERRALSGPLEYLERYTRYFPWYNLQNVTASPHVPHVREAITELYPQAGGTGLSGAVYLDPVGAAALLSLTGPVDVEGLPEPISADNAEQLLTVDIYELYPQSSERDEVLANAIEAIFDALTSRDLPGPKDVADTLAPVVRGGHLSLSVLNPTVEEFLHRAGLDGALDAVPDFGDAFGVFSANAAPNKLDAYLQRTVRYDSTLLADEGKVNATATVTFTNTAPASGLPEEVATNRALIRDEPGAPPPGTAIQYVSIYSSLRAKSATIDGERLSVEAQRELVRNVYSFPLTLAAGESKTVEIQLSGNLEGNHYELVVDHQATVRPDELDIALRLPDGWGVPAEPPSTAGVSVDDGVARWAGTQEEAIVLHTAAPGADSPAD